MTAAGAWLLGVAKLWQGGQEDRCVFGHGQHVTRNVTLRDGSTFVVFDELQYRTETPGYCDGRDEVSKAILANGWWEDAGTAAMGSVLRPSDVVIDIGCHVGWYSMHAARHNCYVLAVDASVEHLRVFDVNAAVTVRPDIGNKHERIVTCRGWIGERTPPIPAPTDGVRVRAVKIDIEGGEAQAIRALTPLLEPRLVDYLLVEVSPCFTGSEAARVLFDQITAHGYAARSVDDPGETTDHAREYLCTVPQRDLWFSRREA